MCSGTGDAYNTQAMQLLNRRPSSMPCNFLFSPVILIRPWWRQVTSCRKSGRSRLNASGTFYRVLSSAVVSSQVRDVSLHFHEKKRRCCKFSPIFSLFLRIWFLWRGSDFEVVIASHTVVILCWHSQELRCPASIVILWNSRATAFFPMLLFEQQSVTRWM